MLLRFEGDKVFPLAPMAVWDKLSDPRFLLTCLPGLEPGAQADETSARWVVRPGLSFVRGTLEVTLQRLEAEPERLVRYQLHGKGIGSSNTVG
ncbi:MAG: CoxG family protein, partial [Gemmataceae bacterium]